MTADAIGLSNSASLHGVRIWLSGALPEAEKSTVDERNAILEFVSSFSASVYKRGGHIIHGSHPNFVPVLLREAKTHQQHGKKKDCLTLAVSRYWSKEMEKVSLDAWRDQCLVYETPEAVGPNARDDSLDILRSWMADRCEAIVVVGGKWWEEIGGRAGVPIEVEYALRRGVPCFLLGGLGGAAHDYLSKHPELLGKLRNGLDDQANQSLATDNEVGGLAQRVCRQLERLPIVRGRSSDGVSFRILALDGGGIKGTFSASALATWESHTRLRIVDHFDLIAGTSTGGILAIGLGIGLSASQMLKFYKERGPTIFPMTSLASRITHAIRHYIQPKLSQDVLLEELEKGYYGGKEPLRLKDSKCRLLIPAYHAIAGATHLFRTPHHPLLTGDAEIEVAHAALATAAAPTYYSAAKIRNMIAESSYFDGGVWANTPALAGIVEAVCYLGVPIDRIDVLSVGTTEEPFTVQKQGCAGIFGWSRKLVRLLMSAQEESSLNHAQLLAGKPRFLRINVVTAPGSYKLDSPTEINELAALGNREASNPDILGQVTSRFLNGVLVTPWSTSIYA